MAIYLFQAADGEVIERSYPMAEAPKIGSEIQEGGKVYRRLISRPEIAVEKSKHFKAWTLPASYNLPPRLREAVPAFDKDQVPLFSSQGEVDEFCAVSKRLHERGETSRSWDYGDGPDAVERHQMKKEREAKDAEEPPDLQVVVG